MTTSQEKAKPQNIIDKTLDNIVEILPDEASYIADIRAFRDSGLQPPLQEVLADTFRAAVLLFVACEKYDIMGFGPYQQAEMASFLREEAKSLAYWRRYWSMLI